jgi:phenylacetate-CoA ligase
MLNEKNYLRLGTSNKRRENNQDHLHLRNLMNNNWSKIRDFCKNSSDEIKYFQFKTLQKLVNHAFNTVPLYNEKYSSAGFEPGDLKSWDDFEKLPILKKEELITGFPEKTISIDYDIEFTTRSSGSSGKFVTLAVSPNAIYTDTIQGARQFYFQTNGNYKSSDLTLFIYTSPWWVSSIDGEYPTEFIPTTTDPTDSIKIIKDLRPEILSTYPTYLKRIMKSGVNLKEKGLKLIVVHSEQSTLEERIELSNHFGVDVLDEFSSEELTRIALECPHRKYHLEEDACYIETMDLNNQKPLKDGGEGLIIGTNLLNNATPIIRYSQGDIGSINLSNNCDCGSNFRLLDSPKGRYMDSIITDDKIIPASCFMDLAYNWYLELDVPVHGLKYQIVQNRNKDIDVFLVPERFILSSSQKERVKNSLYQFVHPSIDVRVHIVNETPYSSDKKYRPIISLVKRE